MRLTQEFVQNRILSRCVNEDGPLSTPCLVWKGGHTRMRYAAITFRGERQRLHRIMYEFANGPIPPDLHVLHKCDRPLCCNPEHLFLGRAMDNYSKLTADEVRQIKMKIADGATNKELAKAYRVDTDTIWNIRRGRNWKHVKV